MRIQQTFFIAAAVISLSACASIFGSSTQEVVFVSPNAENVDCRLQNENYAYHIYTPEIVTLERSYLPLGAVCNAPGYHEERFIIPVTINDKSYYNVANGVIPGTLYDAGARTLPAYPDEVVITMRPVEVVQETVIERYEPVTVIPDTIPYQADLQAEQGLRGAKVK